MNVFASRLPPDQTKSFCFQSSWASEGRDREMASVALPLSGCYVDERVPSFNQQRDSFGGGLQYFYGSRHSTRVTLACDFRFRGSVGSGTKHDSNSSTLARRYTVNAYMNIMLRTLHSFSSPPKKTGQCLHRPPGTTDANQTTDQFHYHQTSTTQHPPWTEYAVEHQMSS